MSSVPSTEYPILELDRFRFLSDWYHVAILDLTLLKGFRSDVDWIAHRLGISPLQVKSATERLKRLGLLRTGPRGLKKTHAKIAVPTDQSEKAIREFHAQMMDQAKAAMERPGRDEFESREIGSATMAINARRIPRARKMIQRFRRELLEFMTAGECSELYQLNVQFFRLTREPSEGGGP